MIITKNTFTEEALRMLDPGVAYDREWLANDVASSLSRKLYDELGGVNAMSMLDLECLKAALETAARSLIDWTRCNRKVNPQEYAELREDGAWPHPMIGGEL